MTSEKLLLTPCEPPVLLLSILGGGYLPLPYSILLYLYFFCGLLNKKK